MELNLINLFPLLSFLKDSFPTTLIVWGLILFFPSNSKNWKKKFLVIFSLIGFDMWLSSGFLNKQLEKKFCSFYKVEQCELVKKVEDSFSKIYILKLVKLKEHPILDTYNTQGELVKTTDKNDLFELEIGSTNKMKDFIFFWSNPYEEFLKTRKESVLNDIKNFYESKAPELDIVNHLDKKGG